MAQKFYSLKEAAEVLGCSEDDVKQMRQRNEIRGFRDGADWKFKTEEIDQLAQQPATTGDEDEGDVLLSEVELGQSDPSTSGTVIGVEGAQPAESDVKLSEEPEPSEAEGGQPDSTVSQFEELDLTLEEDLTLDDSMLDSDLEGAEAADSAVDLSGEKLEDDDLVLGGSGVGSDVTIGADSGISLVDPADSGLSLEEPVELGGSGAESLELGEDDMISLSEGTDTEAPTELKTDDEFLLTPLEEIGDDEESESGSQVIALDTEGDETATMVATMGGAATAAMLDEDLSAAPVDAAGIGAPLGAAAMGGQPAGLAGGAPLAQPDVSLPEAPYSIWNVLGLAVCVIVLVLCGMFMHDLMRNMWSWSGPTEVNSPMMDTIIGWIED